MSSFALPQFHPPIRRGRLYERVVRASIRRADVVSVPSQSVQRDIARFVPDVAGGRVRVIACGVDSIFHPRPAAEIAPILKRLGLTSPYVLYLGTLDLRKNLPRLVEAFTEVVAEGLPHHLVLAGARSWRPNESLAGERVRLPGYIAEADLPFLYAGASLFVYPSFLEGFGFPPLEAMASGVPVIASDNSSLREHLSGAARLVSPENKEEIVAAMRELLLDESARQKAIENGLEHARSFRWARFAEQTLACYEAGGSEINPRQ